MERDIDTELLGAWLNARYDEYAAYLNAEHADILPDGVRFAHEHGHFGVTEPQPRSGGDGGEPRPVASDR